MLTKALKTTESLLVNEREGYTVRMNTIRNTYILSPNRPWIGLGCAGVRGRSVSFMLNIDAQHVYVRTFGQFSGAVPGRSVPISWRLRI
jgi:hypothetical protein